MNSWMSLIIPLIGAVRDLTVLFTKDYGRPPTDEELSELLNARQTANEAWEAVYSRITLSKPD